MSINYPSYSKPENLDNLLNSVSEKYGNYFDNLVENLKIDKNKNKELSKKYYGLVNQINIKQNSINVKKVLRWFLIIFFIFPYFILTKQIKKIQEKVNIFQQEADVFKQKLDEQLNPLYPYFSSEFIYNDILNKSFDQHEFNRNIKQENFNVWLDLPNAFNLQKDETIVDLITGKMYDHPFVLFCIKKQSWIEIPYTASTSISYRNSKGEYETEIITATVFWPFPIYVKNNYFTFKTNIARDLEFDNFSGIKNFRNIKKSYNAFSNVKMDNQKFDNLFPCNRNDETKFRLLFTVLTQENFVNLIESIGQFNMFKKDSYVFVQFPLLKNKIRIKKNWNEQLVPSKKIDFLFNEISKKNSYDLEKLKLEKIQQATNFIRNFCLFQMPIVNMPILIREAYKETNDSKNIKSIIIQDQAFANIAFQNYFIKKNKFETDVIISTELISTKKIDQYNVLINKVYVNYFRSFPKIIPKLAVGLHGSRMVNVIVEDFIPQQQIIYLLQIHNLKTKIDLKIDEEGKILNGVYFKLFNNLIDDSIIQAEINKIEK